MTNADSNSLETGQAGLTGSCAVILPAQQQPGYETGTGAFVAPCPGYTPSTNPPGGPGPVLGCTDPTATNYNALATFEDGSCTYAPSGLTWFDLKALWRAQKPASLVNSLPTRGSSDLEPIPLTSGGGTGGFAYPYTHKTCLHFGRLIDDVITQIFSRFAPITLPSPAVTDIVDYQVSGVEYYAIQFYGVRSPKTLVTPPAKRPFLSSSLYFTIYPVTVPM